MSIADELAELRDEAGEGSDLRAKLAELAERARKLEVELVVRRLARTPFEDVRAFSLKFGFKPPPSPWMAPLKIMALRRRLIEEEVGELVQAMLHGDVHEVAQEAADLLYVTYGAFVDYGVRPEPIWEAVHRANMAKVPSPDGGKVLKPAGWQKPDVRALVEAQVP